MRKTWVALACAALQAGLTWLGQRDFPHLLGTDAYYLLVQAHAVFNTGALKIPDGDPVPYLIASFMKLGMPDVTAFQASLALIQGLMVGAVAGLFMRLAWGWGTLLGVLALVVADSVGLYHAFEFPKLDLAMGLAVAAIAVHRPDPSRRALSLALFAAAALVHAAVLPIAFLCIAFMLDPEGRFSKRRMAVWLVILATASLSLLILSRGDLSRYLQAPGSAGLVVFMQRSNLPGYLQLEVCLITAAVVVISCLSLFKRRYVAVALFAALLALAMLPTPREEMFGLGERMVLVVALSALPMAMLVLGMREPGPAGADHLKHGALALAVVLMSLSWQKSLSTVSLASTDYGRLQSIVDVLAPKRLPMLIASRPLSFYYTAITGRDAFFFDADPAWDRKQVWRIAWEVDAGEILYLAPSYCSVEPDLVEPIPEADAVLVREDCWQSFRGKISREELPGLWDRAWDNELNPSKPRPEYLKARYATKQTR